MLKRATIAAALSALLVLASLLVYTRLANTFKLTTSAQQQQEDYHAPPDQLLVKFYNHTLFATTAKQTTSLAADEELESSKLKNDGALQPCDNRARENVPLEDIEESDQISEDLRKSWEVDVIMRSIALKKKSELPELKPSFCEEDEQHLQATENVFYQTDTMNRKYRVNEVGLMGMVTKSQSTVYSDLYTHRYDNFNDLKLAAGPAVDQEQCLRQLENLTTRTDIQLQQGYHSTDVNLFRLLDTWGHKSAGLFLGNIFMEGMYNECLRMQIEEGDSHEPTRYCVASIKHKDWPKIDKHDILTLRTGVCLPKSCDSTNYKNKHELIMKLLMTNLRPVEQQHMKFHSLFCLPDEDSPLRQVRNSPQAMATLVCLGAWLALLAYCTFKHHQLRPIYEQQGGRKRAASKSFGMTNMNSAARRRAESGAETLPTLAGSAQYKIYKMLSVTNNIKGLFNTKKESSLTSGNGGADFDCKTSGKLIDLSCIEGIKVIAMIYVIMGHVLMCMTSFMQNGRELANSGSMAFFLANLVPAFAVNSFFTITGMLTCYLLFKQNQTQAFITSPIKWTAFIVYRYMRIMPMYALVVLYCKTLAKYTGSGPLWDYATSSLGQRRTCEQEPWQYTLLFGSNFMPPLDHCIPGGWYLSNDFQFFLVTPFFLALLYKRPRLGQLALYGSIIAGYLNGFHSIYNSKVRDLRPIATFAPHGFKTYISHFSFNYTQPQYRIPAYLIGLLVGYELFKFERARLEYQARRRQRQAAAAAAAVAAANAASNEQIRNSLSQAEVEEQEPNWSPGFKRWAIPASLLLVFTCCITPFIGSLLPFNKASARFMVALITPSYHVMFGAAVGLYVLLATTRQGNQYLDSFLSHSFWKPLARVSLCAVLVNVEVINYIVQGNTNLHYINNQFHASLNCICILATYAVAIVTCVLFESPIRAALNTMLTYAIKRASLRGKVAGAGAAAASTARAPTPAKEAPTCNGGEKEKLV